MTEFLIIKMVIWRMVRERGNARGCEKLSTLTEKRLGAYDDQPGNPTNPAPYVEGAGGASTRKGATTAGGSGAKFISPGARAYPPRDLCARCGAYRSGTGSNPKLFGRRRSGSATGTLICPITCGSEAIGFGVCWSAADHDGFERARNPATSQL